MNLKVKICGVTKLDQAIAIADMGADFIGLNFYPLSKRYVKPVDLDEMIEWKCSMPSKTEVVGVFVNPEQDHEFFSHDCLDAIQLHGDESPEFCAALQARGFRVIKAFQVRDEHSLDHIADFDVQDILLDAYHPTERGGLGETFPWELAQAFKLKFPNKSLILAGGLTPENVAEAVRGVHPFAVDVASGVEGNQPGVKDLNKVAQFIQRAKAAALL